MTDGIRDQFYDLRLLDQARYFDIRTKQGRRQSNLTLVKLFFDLIAIAKPQLFIEAGAREALASRKVRAIAPNARIVAFEANPYNYSTYRETIDFEALQIEYRNLAVGDRVGTMDFHIKSTVKGVPQPRTAGTGSLLKRDGTTVAATEYETVTCQIDTIEHFFSDEGAETCALWIDVEGASKEVLTGAGRWIAKASCLIIEVEDSTKWQDQWLSRDVLRFMLDRNLIPIARDFQYRGDQYNVVFVAGDLLHNPGIRRRLAAYQSHDLPMARRRQPVRPKVRPSNNDATFGRRIVNLLRYGRTTGRAPPKEK